MLQRERPWLAFCIRYVWLDLTGPCLFDWPVVSMRGQCALCTGPRNDLHSGWTTDLYSRRHLAMGSGCTALIHPASRSSHIPRYSTILFAWWASVADDGPPFKQNCANISGYTHIPLAAANTQPMLVQRSRRWDTINTTLCWVSGFDGDLLVSNEVQLQAGYIVPHSRESSHLVLYTSRLNRVQNRTLSVYRHVRHRSNLYANVQPSVLRVIPNNLTVNNDVGCVFLFEKFHK